MASEDSGMTFTWTLENICSISRSVELDSPEFIVNCLMKTKWKLGFLQKKDIEGSGKIEKYIKLFKVETKPYNISAMCELSLFDANNEKLETLSVVDSWYHKWSCYRELKLCRYKEYFSRIKIIKCCMWPGGTKFCDTEQGFCRTRISNERRFFMWTVKNVNQIGEDTRFMKIYSKNHPSKSINLILNTSYISKSKLQVELKNNLTCEEWECDNGKCSPYPYIQNCQISIIDIKGNVIVFQNQEKWKKEEVLPPKKISKAENHDKYYFQFPFNSINEKLVETCFQDGSASFRCECDICFGAVLNQFEDANGIPKECGDGSEKCCSSCKILSSLGTPTIIFIRDMQQLYTGKEFCDFTLKTETEIFPVHRAILSVRSPVFKAIFSHDMKESASQSVDIPDLSADTVRRMLLYMYTDKVDDILWKDVFDLYIANDRYRMLNLKKRCSSILKSNLCPANACEILILADERYDEDLKRAAQDYIVEHDLAIIHIDAWKDIEKTNPHLGIDILRKIVIKRLNV